MYNLLDANETVIESNLSVEAAATLLEHTNGDGFSYFYYPIDPAQIQELKNDRGESVRFLKSVSVN
jgi:hypothetical protein